MSQANCGCVYFGSIQMCSIHAAAPELLEALRKLVLWQRNDDDFVSDSAEYCTVNGISEEAFEESLYRQAEAAISKAEHGA